jgi:hypothetical protein
MNERHETTSNRNRQKKTNNRTGKKMKINAADFPTLTKQWRPGCDKTSQNKEKTILKTKYHSTKNNNNKNTRKKGPTLAKKSSQNTAVEITVSK